MLQRSGQAGQVGIKHCRCGREVLAAHRGSITAVGLGVIEKVEPNGSVVARCSCGAVVVWAREVSRPR